MTTQARPRPDGADTAGPALPQRVHRPAPWVRTRLRTAPMAALLTAALAFVTVLLATALPRAQDRGEDAALREYLRGRGATATSLLAVASPRQPNEQRTADLDAVAGKLAARTGETARLTAGGPVYGARSAKPRVLNNPGLAQPPPEGEAPRLDLLYLHGLGEHARLVEGRWPDGAGPAGAAALDAPIPIALAKSAADTIGITLGTVLDTSPSATGAVRAVVVGLYTANDPKDPYWADLGCPAEACQGRTTGKLPALFWQTAGVVGGDALPRLAEWGRGMEDFWRLPVDTETLRADRLADTGHGLASLLTGPAAARLAVETGRPDLRITSRLPEFFAQAQARQAAAAPLAAIGPAGVAGVAAVVLCLAAALTADRRAAELRLLQSRGGSRRGLLLRMLGEGAVTVLPASVLAGGLALWLLPTPRWTPAVAAGLAATLLALLAFPLRAAMLWGAGANAASGGAGAAEGPSLTGRRRLVGELAVLAVTVAAVVEVRRRGVTPPGEGLDPLLVAAPLLLALTGGLLLARLQPALVGALARVAGRRPGLIGFLGLARAARGTGGRPRPSVLPLLALMLAVTTAGFGATVLDAVDTARLRAARLTVGADVSVLAPLGGPLPPAFVTAAAALPGVTAAVPVWSDTEAFVLGTDAGSTRVTVVAADPETYAKLARTVGRGEFDPAVLAGGAGSGDTPVPALFSTELVRKTGTTGTYRVRLPGGGELQAAVVGTVDGAPTVAGSGRAVVVLPIGPATAKAAELGRVNQWFAVGDVDPERLRQLVRDIAPSAAASGQGASAAATAPATPTAATATTATAATATPTASATEAPAAPAATGGAGGTGGYLVRSSATIAADLAADPLQRSAGRLFWAAVLGAAGFALLAVLLTLLRAAPERAALLARLRTMGLRPRQGLALILAEALPQTLVAAVGGGLVAFAAVALLGPALDLSALVGADVPAGLPPAVLPVLTQTLGLAALVTAGVLAEAAVSGRRQITTELRVGDQR
ncbi:hypothetical protein ACWEQL_20100 [Kitasatospora sp. NPDC004240]